MDKNVVDYVNRRKPSIFWAPWVFVL